MQVKLSSLEMLPDHRRLLAKARELFAADNHVLGVLLGGSLADGRADLLSDIDLYLFVRDKDFESVFANREAVARSLGAVLLCYRGDHMPSGKHQLIVWYEGLLHVDLIYRKWSGRVPDWKWKRTVILKDSYGAMAQLQKESDPLRPATVSLEQLQTLSQKFWGWVAYTLGKICRGERWEALDNIAWIRNEALLVMLAWAQNAPYEGHRRLESKLDDELAMLFEQSLCSRELDALHNALMAEVRIFRKLRAQLSTQVPLIFDEEVEEQIMSELEALWMRWRPG
jgi:hypothetical protein